MDPIVDEVTGAIARVEVEARRAAYREQNEFVYVERWLPPALVERLVADVDRVRPAIHRNYIPRHKKGGSVSAHTLVERAPAIVALYRSPAFLELLARLTGANLQRCPATDPHACALYFYTEPGDHIGFHYDTSYYRAARYTLLPPRRLPPRPPVPPRGAVPRPRRPRRPLLEPARVPPPPGRAGPHAARGEP